jgi:hypothetical protein
MSDSKRLHLRGPNDLPVHGSDKLSPHHAGLPRIVEHLLLFALLAGATAFWIAVIVWFTR